MKTLFLVKVISQPLKGEKVEYYLVSAESFQKAIELLDERVDKAVQWTDMTIGNTDIISSL